MNLLDFHKYSYTDAVHMQTHWQSQVPQKTEKPTSSHVNISQYGQNKYFFLPKINSVACYLFKKHFKSFSELGLGIFLNEYTALFILATQSHS